MKIKLSVTCEIQYFELGIFSFNSCVYYLSRGFIVSTRAFNLLTRAFNLPTRGFNLPTRAFNHATRAFRPPTRGFELVIRGFELIIRGFELVTHVCVCVCVCVCLYSSIVKASSDCKMLKTYLRGTDQRSCVVNIYLGTFFQVPSSLFPNLSYFTSKDVTPAR